MRIELERWRLESRPELGLLNKLSDMLRAEGERRPNRLPDRSSCEWLFAGSDYSGQHAEAPYEAYTIMLADLAKCADWEKVRRSVRSRWLADGRRVSYQTLRDRQQERALVPLLEAADSIPGLLLTVLVDRDIENLFRLTEEERTEENLGMFVRWPPATGKGPTSTRTYAAIFEPCYEGTVIVSTTNPEQGWTFGELEAPASRRRCLSSTDAFVVIWSA